MVKAYGSNRETFADYDDHKSPNVRGMWAISRRINAIPTWIRYDRTKHGWHVVIRWNRAFNASSLVALQCVLGSDLKREGLNLMRVLSKPRGEAVKKWNILFSTKLR